MLNRFDRLSAIFKHAACEIWEYKTALGTGVGRVSSFSPDFACRMFQDGGQTNIAIHLGDRTGK